MASQMEDLGYSLIQGIILTEGVLLTQADQEMDLLTQEAEQVMDLLTQEADQEMDLLTQEMDQELDLLTQADQEDPIITLHHITPFITACHKHRKTTQTKI